MHTPQRQLWDFVLKYDPTLDKLPEAFQFGDSPEMADELLALVLAGQKTATTSWPPDPQIDLRAEVGTLAIVLNGAGEPKAIIRTTQVKLRPFLQVSSEFAAAEGEGDLSLEYWRKTHRDFFARQPENPPFSDDAVVQCETFELVWPLEKKGQP